MASNRKAPSWMAASRQRLSDQDTMFHLDEPVTKPALMMKEPLKRVIFAWRWARLAAGLGWVIPSHERAGWVSDERRSV